MRQLFLDLHHFFNSFRYNKKTYRIDDIDWDSKPTDTFDKKNGEKISFVDYYKAHYQITIRDENQVLLVCRPSAREREAGETRNILLIPELCAITGAALMKDFSYFDKKRITDYTKLGPEVN